MNTGSALTLAILIAEVFFVSTQAHVMRGIYNFLFRENGSMN